MLPVVSPDAGLGDLLNPVSDQPDIWLVECLLELSLDCLESENNQIGLT